jgi:ferredoxin-NADP reductase
MPDGRRLRVTVAHEGDGSARVAALEPGTRVTFEGPYGRLHSGVKVARGTVLVAGGIGIAPMRALLEELPAGHDETVLIYRASREEDLVLGRELLDLAAEKGARVVSVTGHRDPAHPTWLPASAAHVGDAAALLQIVPDIADRDVFVCGAPAWMDHVVTAAKEAGVPAAAIHHERFSW